MSDIAATALEAAAAQVPLATVFLVAIVAIVWYALRENGAVIDRNTIGMHNAADQSKAVQEELRLKRKEQKLNRRLMRRILLRLDRLDAAQEDARKESSK